MNACTWVFRVLFMPLVLNQDCGRVRYPLTPWDERDLHKHLPTCKAPHWWFSPSTPLVLCLLVATHCISEAEFGCSSQKQPLCLHFISRRKEKWIFGLFYLGKIKTGKQWLVFPMELSVWCRIKAPGSNGRCKSLHVVHIPGSHLLFRWALGSIDVGTNQARSVETQWSYSCSLGFLLHSFFSASFNL